MCDPPGTVSALIMAHQIDLFCVPQLADTGCLEADHNGGSACGYQELSAPLAIPTTATIAGVHAVCLCIGRARV
jgi:hypothetical protein